MILEEFAKYLHSSNQGIDSSVILARWLWEKLTLPPSSNVDRVIHCEISFHLQDQLQDSQIPPTDDRNEICFAAYRSLFPEEMDREELIKDPYSIESSQFTNNINDPSFRSTEHNQESLVFCGKSPSGAKLLNSLISFAQSYENQKVARWLHDLKASDFSKTCSGTEPEKEN